MHKPFAFQNEDENFVDQSLIVFTNDFHKNLINVQYILVKVYLKFIEKIKNNSDNSGSGNRLSGSYPHI